MNKNSKLQLTLERDGGKLWGRVLIEDNLITDSAATLQSLEKKIRKLLKDFEGLEEVEF